jgi:acyl-CoA hydrolase
MSAPEPAEPVLDAADLARVLAEFRPGLRVYLQGGVGEPLVLRRILAAAPQALAGVAITACLLPQMNDFDYAALEPSADFTTFLLPDGYRASFAAGRVRVRPLAYSTIAAVLASEPPFDLAILQLSAPDAEGLCSFGPCADFAPIVWPRARRRLAFVNETLPRTRRGPTAPLAAMDVVVEAPGPFVTGADAAPTPALAAIATRLAELIPDGAAIQTGIGGAPAAAVGHLSAHRRLKVRSGMVTPGYRRLAEAGALDPDAEHVTGLALGDADFMTWASQAFTFADARTTHDARALEAVGPLFAINSALEIDLFGQVNLEWRGGRLFSGLGGAPDFARAARRSGGRAILALPASARGEGGASRIVGRLSSPTVSLPRNDIDIVVTEHGVARLADTDLDGRAERLIAIAAPDHRAMLTAAWRAIREGI